MNQKKKNQRKRRNIRRRWREVSLICWGKELMRTEGIIAVCFIFWRDDTFSLSVPHTQRETAAGASHYY